MNMHFDAHMYAFLLGVYQEEDCWAFGYAYIKFQFSFRTYSSPE